MTLRRPVKVMDWERRGGNCLCGKFIGGRPCNERQEAWLRCPAKGREGLGCPGRALSSSRVGGGWKMEGPPSGHSVLSKGCVNHPHTGHPVHTATVDTWEPTLRTPFISVSGNPAGWVFLYTLYRWGNWGQDEKKKAYRKQSPNLSTASIPTKPDSHLLPSISHSLALLHPFPPPALPHTPPLPLWGRHHLASATFPFTFRNLFLLPTPCCCFCSAFHFFILPSFSLPFVLSLPHFSYPHPLSPFSLFPHTPLSFLSPSLLLSFLSPLLFPSLYSIAHSSIPASLPETQRCAHWIWKPKRLNLFCSGTTATNKHTG